MSVRVWGNPSPFAVGLSQINWEIIEMGGTYVCVMKCGVVWCGVLHATCCISLKMELRLPVIPSLHTPSHHTPSQHCNSPFHHTPSLMQSHHPIPSGRRGVALEVSMRYGDFLNPLGGVGNAHPNNGFGATSISVLEGFDDQSMGRSFPRVICCLS